MVPEGVQFFLCKCVEITPLVTVMKEDFLKRLDAERCNPHRAKSDMVVLDLCRRRDEAFILHDSYKPPHIGNPLLIALHQSVKDTLERGEAFFHAVFLVHLSCSFS